MAAATARPGPLGISADLWEILACPCAAHAPVTADLAAARVACTSCGRSFEVRDGIPVMLLDAAESPTAQEPADAPTSTDAVDAPGAADGS